MFEERLPEKWENVTISCGDILGVNYWIWRSRGYIRRLEKEIKVKTTYGDYVLRSRLARRQFLHHLGLSIREVEKVKDWQIRNNAVAVAIQRRLVDEKRGDVKRLVFRVLPNNEVWSVVTEDYVEVPVGEVVGEFESLLSDEGFIWTVAREWDSGRAVYKIYKLYRANHTPLQVGDVASAGVVLKIGYSGDRAVSLYGFFEVLACQNGLITSRDISAVKLIHKISKEKILSGLKAAFIEWSKTYPQFAQLVDEARKVSLTEKQELEILDKVLAKYPLYMRRRIESLLRTKYVQEHGLFKLSQAISDYATHAGITQNYRQMLQQDAYKILTIKPEVKTNVS